MVFNCPSYSNFNIKRIIPARHFEMVSDLPANEHLTMQIARQLFNIRTAANAIIFFKDGSPAYITRRFDYKPDGNGKLLVEDFAVILQKTRETEGDQFKYNSSYLDIAIQIQKKIAAAPLALLEYFKLIIFNYLIGNGDAHLKNFSLIETRDGDYFLAPAYDLVCTSLHINDSDMALRDGLYEKDYEENDFATFGYYTQRSFLIFAQKAGIKPALASKALTEILKQDHRVPEFISRSYLSREGKKKYLAIFSERRQRLRHQ